MLRHRLIGQLARAALLIAGQSGSFSALAAQQPVSATPLLLDVVVNGRPTNLIVPFQRRDGRMWASAVELRGLRLIVDALHDTTLVPLDAVEGLTYAYDEQSQAIALTIGPERLAPSTYNAWREQEADAGAELDLAPTRSAVLRYSLVAAGEERRDGFSMSGVSASLDGRIYSGNDEVAATALIGRGPDGLHTLRLSNTLTRVDPARQQIIRLGDSITGGTAWSRSIRFAGLQVGHDFSTRPDLVTVPLPGVTGSAAVPSALDVYIDGLKRYSTAVSEGQFRIDDLPATSGAGTARVVMRDLQGREIVTSTPFFVSDRLLRAGLYESTAEAGFARRNYGVRSFDYARQPIASASGRVGVTNSLTVEGHVEGSQHLGLAGGGATLRAGRFGVASIAAAGSTSTSGNGALIFAGLETQVGPVRLTMETQRTTRLYFDLAALTSNVTDFAGRVDRSVTAQPPRVSDRATVSLPVIGVGGSVSVSYARQVRNGDADLETASLYYSRSFGSAFALNVSLFHLSGRSGNGAFGGLSFPFGSRSSASAGLAQRDGRVGLEVEAQRSLDVEPGSVGWRVAARNGQTDAAVAYRSDVATIETQVARRRGRTFGTLGVEGAVIATGGSTFLRSRLDGGFAVVDVGAPGVTVLSQNRPVGRTNGQGLLLVGDLRPYQRNRLAIDPDGLPLERSVDQPVLDVRPAASGGVRVTFAAHDAARVLHLVDERGYDLPMGAEASINGNDAQVIGFDGLVLLPSLSGHNSVRALIDGQTCFATFEALALSSEPTGRPIGPVVCRPLARVAAAVPLPVPTEGR